MDYIDNDHFSMRIREGILDLRFKEGTHIDLAMAIRLVSERLLLQNGKAYPILCDVSHLFSIAQPARNYISKEGSALVKALSLLALSELSAEMAHFFLQTQPPRCPARVFRDRADALAFLLSHN